MNAQLVSGLLCLFWICEPLCAPVRPNIVFILIDDLRHDTFGFMNHPFIETPNIDQLANKGAVFTHAFVTTSLCSPARASFLTGQYMHRHGVVDNQSRISAGTVTFSELLQADGYETAFLGKWHMGGSSDAPRPGFDHWLSFRGQGRYFPEDQFLNINGDHIPMKEYMTDELTNHAVDWLKTREGKKPFLLYLSHKGVHGLYDPAPRHLNRYRNVTTELPETEPDSSETPMWVKDQRNSWHGIEFPYYGRSGQTVDEMYRHYSEMILSIDDSVGQVIRTLRETEREGNTLVVFTSDGGHLWGEHGLIDKRCAYEESIRIPMIVYGPGFVRAGVRIEEMVANIDVAPTLLELAGLKVPDFMDGKSFIGFLDGSQEIGEWRTELLYEYYWEPSYPQTPTMFALRGKRFKLIQYYGIWDTDELFDISADPFERNNLIHNPEQGTRVQEMRARLYQELRKTGGSSIPLGFKRGDGSNLRDPNGSQRSEFPSTMLQGRSRE